MRSASARSTSLRAQLSLLPASQTTTDPNRLLQIDVFTLVPHAFGWLTEQRPLAAVLGAEIDLRLLGYRDTTPLANGQVDDAPYGGLPAMVLVDAIARLQPGALAEESPRLETFSAELEGGVEFPQYTRPAEFRGWRVPEVLVSGDHARIEDWRREQSRARSAK